MKTARPWAPLLWLQLSLIALVPVIVIGALLFSYAMPNVSRSADEQKKLVAFTMRNQIEQFLETPFAILQTARVELRDVRAANSGEPIDRILDGFQQSSHIFSAIYLTNRDNHVINIGLPHNRAPNRHEYLGLEINPRDPIEAARRTRQPQWSDTFLSAAEGQLAVALALPLPDSEEVLVAEIPLHRLSAYVARIAGDSSIVPLILDRKHHVVAHPTYSGEFIDIGRLESQRDVDQATGKPHSLVIRGERFVGVSLPIRPIGWRLLIAQNEVDANKAQRQAIGALLAGIVICLVISLMVVLLVSRRISGSFGAIMRRADTSENRFRKTFEAGGVPMFLAGADGTVVEANDEMKRFLGCESDELIGHRLSEFETVADTTVDPADGGAAIAGSIEKSFRRRDGGEVWGLYNSVAVEDDNEEVLRNFGVIQDITVRKQASLRLQAVAERLRRENHCLEDLAADRTFLNADIDGFHQRATEAVARVTNTARVGIWAFDADRDGLVCRDIYVLSEDRHKSEMTLSVGDNPAYFQALHEGRSIIAHDANTEPRTSAFSGTYLQPLGITSLLDIPIKTGDVVKGVFCCEHIGPARTWTEDEIGFVRAVADLLSLVRETSEHRAAQAQLVQAQKMEAVGRLTGGIAHDFNNLLAIISGNLELLNDDLIDGEAREMVASALRASTRGANLVRSLLAFSRRQDLNPDVLDVNKLITDMTDLLRRTLPAEIDIRENLADDLWACMADGGQLQNALLNLVINARDAIAGSGQITVETGNVDMDDEYAAAHAEVQRGRYVRISVSDDGSGMGQEIINQAFEPFFTTKPIGEGSGLGLSMVFGFTKQSGGHTKIYSEPGVGTTITLYLPRAETAADVPAEPSSAESDQSPRGARIMVVEDDPDVRILVLNLLQSCGHEVVDAATPKGALELLGQGCAVDLLLTDVVLPGAMNGCDLAKSAAAIVPGLKVLLMSGYSENAVSNRHALGHGVNLIQKPFTKTELDTQIRETLIG